MTADERTALLNLADALHQASEALCDLVEADPGFGTAEGGA